MSPLIVIMGVSGCGKTTIANSLAERIGGHYLEGDSFHNAENKAKMGQGIPLTDEDRWPWFDALIEAAKSDIDQGVAPVLSCSALKQAYRDYLFAPFDQNKLIYLHGSFELIKKRMDERDHEYMTSDLLRSQFETLEEPINGASVMTISIEETPKTIVDFAVEWLKQN
ncbi:MAG: gluconokinase [Verrucomicrobiota bacterium]